jgi:hypothetical protein
MASKPVLMNAVFDQFTSFVKELIEMYPDDLDFSLFLNSLKILKTTNPSLLIKYVYENTSQFEEQILNKDEKFFVNYSFSEYSDNVDLNIFSKLKQYLENMTLETKENVWKYIQNIYRLSKAISNMN